MSVGAVNLQDKFALVQEQWSPHIVGELNGQHVLLAKIQGTFVWHDHPEEDELFMVVRGSLVIHLRDRDVEVGEGEFYIVPRGVEHMPEAAEECHLLLFEPRSTAHTGDAVTERTVVGYRRI